MSDNLKKILCVIIVIIVISLSVIVLLVPRLNNSNNSYDDNQVIYKNVTYFDVGRTYLSDYLTIMFSDVEAAYNLLDNNYKKELGGFENFKELVNNFIENNYFDVDVVEFKMKEADNYKLFYLKDNNDKIYIFKEKGIMDYTVYLSESSVEL